MPTRTRRRLREHTVGLLARKWTLEIAVALSSETMRHSEIARCLPGITQKVLTETLREMERTGIVEREVYPIVPPRVEYRLTGVGIELLKLSQEFARPLFSIFSSDSLKTHPSDAPSLRPISTVILS